MKSIVIVTVAAMFIGMAASVAFGQMMEPGTMGMGPGARHEMMEQRGGYGMGYGPGMMGMHGGCFSHFEMLEELDLSDGQKEKLRDLKSKFTKLKIMVSAKLKVAKMEFRDLMSGDTLDMKALGKKIAEITELKGKQLMEAAKASEATRKILSKEQIKKARGLMLERMGDCEKSGRRMMRHGWDD